MGQPFGRRLAAFTATVATASLVLLSACQATTDGVNGSDGPGVAPTITAPPASSVVTEGEPASFTVAARGTAPLSYRWQRNGTTIAGATAATYTLPQAALSDSGAQYRAIVSNAAGSVTSDAASLTVNPASPGAPSITTPLANRTVNVGQTASFAVVASGSGLSYAWRKNGTAIPGAPNAAGYTTPAAVAGDDGAVFAVVVSNVSGSVTSSATLTVRVPPSITTQPADVTVRDGETATFTVLAAGTPPLSYQWQRNGIAIPGATAASYTTPAAAAADSGATFRATVTNPAGSVTSDPATLTVGPPPVDGAMRTASRTSGVAPLAVFFDAIDDVARSTGYPTFAWTSDVFQPADPEGSHYAWEFGDPGSGKWSTTDLSRNTATGYTAAHVFESPGPHIVRLTLTDSTGTVRTYSQTITVTDPATVFASTTRYVASNGDDGNDGTEAAPYATLGKAMEDVAAGTAKRVLLRRGDSFTAATSYAITAEGPGLIGAYGAGNRPIVNVTYNGEANVFSPRGTGTDWRVMDLELRGPGNGYPTGPVGPPNDTRTANLLALRLKMTSGTWQVSLGWGDYWPRIPAVYQLSDGLFVVECEAPSPSAHCYYVGGRRVALLGNSGTDSQGSHVARMWMGHKAVVSHNHFLRCQTARHELKLHGAPQDGRPATRWISITDNRFDASDVSQWSLAIGPQDNASNEEISHVLIERNRLNSGASSANSIEVNASHTMIRNNLFDFTGSPQYGSAALIWRRGVEPIPTNIRAYNNTCYKRVGTSDTTMFDVRSPVTYVEVRNNLGVAWNTTTNWRVFSNSTSTGWVESNNLLTTQTAVADDLSLADGSPAIDNGAALPQVLEDFLRAPRPGGTRYDIGAFERQ